MPNLSKGTVVGKGHCAACGKPGLYEVSKTGSVFMICNQPDDVTFKPCNSRLFFGKKRSQEMQAAYLATRKSTPKEEPQNVRPTREPADIPDEPQQEPVRAGNIDDGDIFKSYG